MINSFRLFRIVLSTLMLFALNVQAAKSTKNIEASRYKFNKIAPVNLPSNNITGNMNEIISALNNQIKNCEDNKGEYQTIKIANLKFTRQQWCLDTNQKMLVIAKAAKGDFKQFFTNIKNEFDWYKSTGWPENHGKFRKGDIKFTAYYYSHNRRIPYGIENIPLTPHSSCATDHRVIPIGMIILYSSKKSTSLCIAQDSGSAVKGAHVDLYKGKGQQAGKEGKHLFHAGSLFVALPKSK